MYCQALLVAIEACEKPRSGTEQAAGAVAGDRLYVASANGWVGSYPIPSITDPARSPTMDWRVETGAAGADAPVVTADDEAVYLADDDRPGFVTRVSPDGEILSPTRLPGVPQAFAWQDGALHAAGAGWTTFGDLDLPSWFGGITYLSVAG